MEHTKKKQRAQSNGKSGCDIVPCTLPTCGVFLAANATKIADGGWFPLAFGCAVYLLLSTWKAGRERVTARLGTHAILLTEFVDLIEYLASLKKP